MASIVYGYFLGDYLTAESSKHWKKQVSLSVNRRQVQTVFPSGPMKIITLVSSGLNCFSLSSSLLEFRKSKNANNSFAPTRKASIGNFSDKP